MTKIGQDFLYEYRQGNVQLTPMYPGILIRLLPKPAFMGMLYIPEDARNKPMYEAVVIATYAPREVPFRGSQIRVESDLKPGDHIVFPYWSGQPIPGLSEDEYRVIPDRNLFNQMKNDTGGAVLTVDYTSNVRERLETIVGEAVENQGGDIHFAPRSTASAVNALLEEFDIIPRNMKSVLSLTDTKSE